MHCKDVCPPLQKWCVPLHIQLCVPQHCKLFLHLRLVVCSWGGGHVALSFRRTDQFCGSLFVGQAGGHSSLYGAFLAFA